MASAISQAWSASSVVRRAVCPKASSKSAARELAWVRFEIPSRRGRIPDRKGRRAGMAMLTRTRAVQSLASMKGRSHPASKARKAAGAERVRRRLSTIFQRPISGISALDRRLPDDSRQAENPGKELPIAPRPAMLARRRDVVAGGIFLHELDIGHQPGAGEDPLEKVVAEDRILGDSSLQGGLEGIDVVDALAGEGALAEEILIHVGDGKGIGIHAGGAGEDALESRSFASRRQGGGDARLQHAIAGDDPPGLRIELGTVQRMGHLAHEPLHGAAGQPRIGVQGDDIAHARGHRRRAAAYGQEGRVGRAAKQPVQLMELAALALPADPLSLPRVPDPAPMEQEEALPFRARVMAAVQLRDALDGDRPAAHRRRGPSPSRNPSNPRARRS